MHNLKSAFLSAHSVVTYQHQNVFSGREGGEEKEQGRANSVEVSGQLIVAVAAKLLVRTPTQSCALVLDTISWYLICVHSWGQPSFFPLLESLY